MADKGIIFSAAMVRALLDGRKTQTRRLLKPQPPEWATFGEQPAMYNALHQWVPSGLWRWSEPEQSPLRELRAWPLSEDGTPYWLRPAYQRGDRLYVREACAVDGPIVWYRLDHEEALARGPRVDVRWRPSIHMPRWTSRLWLAVTDVRVQRLQECSEVDAIAEGAFPQRPADKDGMRHFGVEGAAIDRPTAVLAYAELWNSLHTAEGERWQDNPWVVAVSFDVHRGNIDAQAQAPA